MYLIYKFKNMENGKVYIGWTSTSLARRTKAHIKESRRQEPPCIFHQALKKYGLSNFTFDVISTVDSADEAKKAEMHFIRIFDCCILDGPDKGYNMTRGGDGFDSDTVRKNNLKRVKEGTHPWAGERGSLLNSQTQKRLISEGRHHWAGAEGSKRATENLKRRNENGTNPWGGEKGSQFAKANAQRLKDEGRFHSQQKRTCPHCGKSGQGNSMLRWHFDHCKLKKIE